MRAIGRGTAILHRGAVSTGYGDVFLESRYEDALRVTIDALNAHDAHDALVEACEAFLRARRSRMAAPYQDYKAAILEAEAKTRAALALVRGEGDQ